MRACCSQRQSHICLLSIASRPCHKVQASDKHSSASDTPCDDQLVSSGDAIRTLALGCNADEGDDVCFSVEMCFTEPRAVGISLIDWT